MGEKFITYEVLFSVGLMKNDSSGQAFFMQVDRNHFPVPIPQLTKVDTWDNQAMWKLDTATHRQAIEANPINGEFRRRNIPFRIPAFDPEDDSAFDAIKNYQEESENSQAKGSGAPPSPQEEEEEEEEVEAHCHPTRANCRCGRPNVNEEFQANTSAQLGDICKTCPTLGTIDGQSNNKKTPSIAKDGRHKVIGGQRNMTFGSVKGQRMAVEARDERQTMSSDITYLIGTFYDLNARFPPPQE